MTTPTDKPNHNGNKPTQLQDNVDKLFGVDDESLPPTRGISRAERTVIQPEVAKALAALPNRTRIQDTALLDYESKLFEQFKKAPQTRHSLQEYLTASNDKVLAAEFLIEHFRPRTHTNINGRGITCACRMEDGEECSVCGQWRDLFHDRDEMNEAPPITFAIDGFLQNDAITLIAGLPSHGKTFVMLSMAKSLLDATPLFGYEPFSVNTTKEDRVVYLCPEASLSPFTTRMRKFGLDQHVGWPPSGRFFYYTISSDERIDLRDIRLKKAVHGAHVFLDTAIRFLEGDENSSVDQRVFSQNLFDLIKAGAKSVTAGCHSPKSMASTPPEFMSLENSVRGTGEIGAMAATCWSVKKIDPDDNMLVAYVKNTKARDFPHCKPFVLDGRSIDTAGNLSVLHPPGDVQAITNGKAAEKKKKAEDRYNRARELAASLEAEGKSVAEANAIIAEKLDAKIRTVREWRMSGKLETAAD